MTHLFHLQDLSRYGRWGIVGPDLLVEKPLDEGFPEVLLHPLGFQHQPIMQFTQMLNEAVGARARLVVLVAKVIG